MLGGDHTATVPVLEVLAPAVPDLRVLQLDAHPDLREEFLGERYNYASAMARVMDVVPAERVYQVGMRRARGTSTPSAGHTSSRTTGRRSTSSVASCPELVGHPLYVTIDVDVLDPPRRRARIARAVRDQHARARGHRPPPGRLLGRWRRPRGGRARLGPERATGSRRPG
jgi:arginase family enzyme